MLIMWGICNSRNKVTFENFHQAPGELVSLEQAWSSETASTATPQTGCNHMDTRAEVAAIRGGFLIYIGGWGL